MNIEQKAMAACIEMAATTKEIKRLSNVISDSLCECFKKYAAERFSTGEITIDNESHLKAAYAFEISDEGDRFYLSKNEQLELLSVCPDCLAAHNAIQDRKAARRKLGGIKRSIMRIGSKT